MAAEAFDPVDRALLHALQIDGRAPFRRIAEVLGVSDQTVARRYGRLRSENALRVVGLTGPDLVVEQWLLRVRAAPSAAGDVAEALARAPEVSWVQLCGGGTEILATAYGADVGPTLLLTALPRTRAVVAVDADQVLHTYYGGAGQPYAKDGPLDEDQLGRLREHLPARVPPVPPDDADHRLLRVLRDDGRAPVERLSAATGLAAVAVRRRLHDLRAGGVVRFDVDLDFGLLRLGSPTMLRLTVDPLRVDEAGEALAAHREIAFAAATTGEARLFATAVTAGPAALHRYLTTAVAELPGLVAVATTPVLRTVKAATTRYGPRS